MKYSPYDISAQEVRCLLNKPAPCILEIGAWEGDSTSALLAAMPAAHIVAFEPDPRPLERLSQRFAGDSRVIVVPRAVGAITGMVSWYASGGDVKSELSPGDWSLSSSLRKPTHHLQRSPEITFSEQTVYCVRLDDWAIPQAFGFDFAWIDAQGAQRDIVAGGSTMLEQIPFIYIELHHTPEYDGEPTFAELCALFPQHTPIARYAENILFEKLHANA